MSSIIKSMTRSLVIGRSDLLSCSASHSVVILPSSVCYLIVAKIGKFINVFGPITEMKVGKARDNLRDFVQGGRETALSDEDLESLFRPILQDSYGTLEGHMSYADDLGLELNDSDRAAIQGDLLESTKSSILSSINWIADSLIGREMAYSVLGQLTDWSSENNRWLKLLRSTTLDDGSLPLGLAYFSAPTLLELYGDSLEHDIRTLQENGVQPPNSMQEEASRVEKFKPVCVTSLDRLGTTDLWLVELKYSPTDRFSKQDIEGIIPALYQKASTDVLTRLKNISRHENDRQYLGI